MAISFKDQIKVRKGQVTAYITGVLFKEGDIWVSYSPALDISSYGSDVEDAARSLQETVSITLQDLVERGKLNEDLVQHGWKAGEFKTYSYKSPDTRAGDRASMFAGNYFLRPLDLELQR